MLFYLVVVVLMFRVRLIYLRKFVNLQPISYAINFWVDSVWRDGLWTGP